MEINSMLCVGRGRLSQFGKSHLSNSGFQTPERKSSAEMNNGTELTEKELVARVSSKLSGECLSPPTKSILRGRLPSPKQGSPSSLRSVRFSDKESDDEIMYAKIHVNKNVQTEHIHREKTEKKTGSSQAMSLDLAQNHEEFNPKAVHEMKTSTPRYSILEGTPSLDFQTSRGRQEDRKRSQKSPIHDQVSVKGKYIEELKDDMHKSEKKHERIVFDINIDRKRPTELTTSEYKESESKITAANRGRDRKPASVGTDTRTGSKIIQNMDLNRSQSKSPERMRPMIPDGSKIIQNMDLNNGNIVEKVRTTASQTSCSDTSSPRSASPETPYESMIIPDGRQIIKNMDINSHDAHMKSKSVQTKMVPDGEKIIQNLELSLQNSSFNMRSESSQTVDIPDGRKITQNMEHTDAQKRSRNISIGVQTFDEDSYDEEYARSVPVQTDLNMSEDNSPNESTDYSKPRSIAVQTQSVNEQEIPDGSKITKNMELYKSEKRTEHTATRNEKNSLNDSNWNEFVRHLELFNPRQSSSSSASISDEEMLTTPKAEPILVYDRNAPSAKCVNKTTSITHEGKPSNTQRVSDRSAGTFLKSEAYTRHQYESVLREEGLLSKLDSGLKSNMDPSVSAKLLVEKAFAKNKGNFERTKVNAKKQNNESALLKQNNEELRKQKMQQTKQIPVSSYYREPVVDIGTHGSNINLQQDQRQKKSDKENLGFTPIETYSFNPETLMKTAAKRGYTSNDTLAAALKPHNVSKPTTSSILGTKESVTKNSFIQGLDLGPVPKPPNSQRYPSLLSTRMMSEGSDTNKTILNRDGSKHNNIVQSKYEKKYGNGFSESPKYNISTSSSRPSATAKHSSHPLSLSGYQRSDYSHVTGHRSGAFSSDYNSSLSQNRPSSAPLTRNKLYQSSSPLSSTLRSMRNNALRKNAMHQYADHKKRSSALATSSFSAPTHPTRTDNMNTTHMKSSYVYDNTSSCKHSMQNHLRSTSDNVSTTTIPESVYERKGTTRYSSNRHALPRRSDYMYLSALNDQSNVRPPSRDRSRSRSRSPARSTTIDLGNRQSGVDSPSIQRSNAFSTNKSTRNLGDKISNYIGQTEDPGTFDSSVSSNYRSYVTSHRSNAESISERESRPLTRKPPLPKSPRSSSNGRSRSRSADSLSRASAKQGKEVNKGGQHHMAERKSSPGEREILKKTDKSRRAVDSHDQGTVSIGEVPSGLVDPECLFLGHDTIQKIIEEAKL